jgi:two-component system nitrate/nitrite response regulator NarL
MFTLSPPSFVPDVIWDPIDEREHPGRSPARVILADDHPLYRDGLARAISAHHGLELVGEAGEGVSALALVEELEPDIALLDVKMPDPDGLEICRLLAERRPALATRVVLLSAFIDVSLVSRAVCAGAAGYLSKEIARLEICDALADVAAGGTAYGSQAIGGLVEELERLYRLEPPGPPATKGL